MEIQFFGGRGAISSNGGLYSRTVKQDKAIKKLAKQTANLKKEQYRIIDGEGNVLVKKQGLRHEVAITLGEKRQYLNDNISLHNHPAGGTFSSADISDFGNGAKEIVVASPEGTYRLINMNHGTRDQYVGWRPMQEKLEALPEQSFIKLRNQAVANTANTSAAKQLDGISQRYDQIRRSQGQDKALEYATQTRKLYDSLTETHRAEIQAEVRRLETKPFDDFYRANAKSYGFKYVFEPNKQAKQ